MVTAGGVENWNSDLSASVAFYGVGNWVVFIAVAAMISALPGRVLKLTKSKPPVTKLQKTQLLIISRCMFMKPFYEPFYMQFFARKEMKRVKGWGAGKTLRARSWTEKAW